MLYHYILERPKTSNPKDYMGKKVAVWSNSENPIIDALNASNPVIATLITITEELGEPIYYGISINVNEKVLAYYENMRPLTDEEISKEIKALCYNEEKNG
jgi:hypothetical protein